MPPGGALPNRPLERQQGTDNGTGILGGKERGSLPLIKRTLSEKPQDSRPSPPSLKRTRRSCAGRYGRHFPKLAALTSFLPLLLREGVTVKESRGRLSYLTPDRKSLSQPGSWGTILTRLLSLPCSRRTPTEPPNRPKPYPNTPTPKRDACGRKKPQKPPRQTTPCSAWLTGKPSEPRARAWAMTAGRKAQPKANGSYCYRLSTVRLFFPGGTGRSLFCRLCRHAGKPYRAEAGGKRR